MCLTAISTPLCLRRSHRPSAARRLKRSKTWNRKNPVRRTGLFCPFGNRKCQLLDEIGAKVAALGRGAASTGRGAAATEAGAVIAEAGEGATAVDRRVALASSDSG